MGQSNSSAARIGGYHIPVLVSEVSAIFRPLAGGVIVDATFGGGGHSTALLDAVPDIRIVAIDRDPDAQSEVLDDRLQFVAGNFADLASLLDVDHGFGRVSGVLFDLGVSSHQLDVAERGFSYHRAGPLDMRMDQQSSLSADVIVNTWELSELARAFKRFGEERFAGRIAAAIIAARPIGDTAQLSEVISEAVPAAARRRRHPARRVFQAIRIVVNGELDALEQGLESALSMVPTMGRVAVISYHSLEDRMVKHRFAAGSAQCECPPGLPVCVCDKTTELRSLTRGGITPSPQEIGLNPRARSARLRAVEKVAP